MMHTYKLKIFFALSATLIVAVFSSDVCYRVLFSAITTAGCHYYRCILVLSNYFGCISISLVASRTAVIIEKISCCICMCRLAMNNWAVSSDFTAWCQAEAAQTMSLQQTPPVASRAAPLEAAAEAAARINALLIAQGALKPSQVSTPTSKPAAGKQPQVNTIM